MEFSLRTCPSFKSLYELAEILLKFHFALNSVECMMRSRKMEFSLRTCPSFKSLYELAEI